MPFFTPITRQRQIKNIKKNSLLILNDLMWVRREIWKNKTKINMTISYNKLTSRLYIFLRLPPQDRVILTLRELLWRSEFLNFEHSFNVTPRKMIKWINLCSGKDVLIF